MADPVSWLMIQSGWQVVASDGEDVGKVSEVLGAPDEDIFDGLAVGGGLVLERPKYVPSESVGPIVEGRVELTLSAEQFAQLGDYET